MRIEQRQWSAAGGWEAPTGAVGGPADVVLFFGAPEALTREASLGRLRELYGPAPLFGCSTAGEIGGVHVRDGSVVATAVRLEKSRLRIERIRLGDVAGDSGAAGRKLAGAFPVEGLRHLFVLSDGIQVNGSELVRGMTSVLPKDVGVTGGLSGDGDRFAHTFVCAGEGGPEEGVVAAVGFYGPSLRVGCGSLGGWDPFGPERCVTRSAGNVLYELDGRSALALYKEYLGEHAAGLPASGLLFPLSLRGAGSDPGVVRTLLAVDEQRGSVTFAGDVPEGRYVRLMKANFERLIDGASGAAQAAAPPGASTELALLISCVGRKLVLQQRVEEEVEAAREALAGDPVLAGFYSYGEISPFTASARCELHNQTMTITTLSEA
ncbi:MAG TPA: FIST N-terminal domain-containing protein [Myxococcales bacterium]|nr:FIST N-terminal domain-containing protein [Myxococcales bacterium]